MKGGLILRDLIEHHQRLGRLGWFDDDGVEHAFKPSGMIAQDARFHSQAADLLERIAEYLDGLAHHDTRHSPDPYELQITIGLRQMQKRVSRISSR